MPIHVYPPIDELTYETASLRNFTGNCASPGSSTVTETASNVRSIRRQHATGWRLHGYHKMKNDGRILPFTPWYKFTLNTVASQGHREWCASSTSARNRWDNLYRGGTALDFSSADLRSKVDLSDLPFLTQKAAAKIASSGFDALTFLAEARQLQRMFTGVANKFRRLTDRKNLTFREAANNWLEGRYGWRTLLYDIVDLHGAVISANDRRTRYRQAVGLNAEGNDNTYSESNASGIISGFSTEISWSASMRSTVVADIEIPGFQFNPVTTAWELTKLSFVVDWLLNIGQALDAATFLLLSKSYQAGVGYKIDFDLSYTISHVGKTGTTIVHANDGSCSGSAQIVTRESTSVSALPRVKLRLDALKAVDLLALAYQQLSKRR